MAPCAMADEALPMPMHEQFYSAKSTPTPTNSSNTTVLASVLHGPRDLRLDVRRLDLPLAGELQIAIKSTGICGSDVSYYKKFANGDLCACSPLSLGHESSGVVVALGPDVGNFKVGDRVALEVGIPCGECGICRKGRYNLCKKMRFRSSAKSVPHFQGTLQERINHPAIWCHKLPSSISFNAAALLEPLAVALHSVNRAAPTPGATALVLGAGTVGLLVATVARQAGCAEVTIVDVDEGRVKYALENGFATHGFVVPKNQKYHPVMHHSVLHPSISHSSIAEGALLSSSHSSVSDSLSSASSANSDSGTSTPAIVSGVTTPMSIYGSVGIGIASKLADAKALAAEILAVSTPAPSNSPEGEYYDEEEDIGHDLTFECTGKETCMQTALYATRPGGKVIMVGMGTPIQTLPLSAAHLREVDILGIFRYANCYKTGIRLLSAGVDKGRKIGEGGLGVDLEKMVTHRVHGLAGVGEAFELAGRTVDGKGDLVLKVVVEM